jgi:hypothetical protein
LIDAQSPEIYPCGWTELVGHDYQSCPELPKLEDYPEISSSTAEDFRNPPG